MLNEQEKLLLEHLGRTEEWARKRQKEDNYTHLIDCLAILCREKDRNRFFELTKSINDKFRSIGDFQTAWDFMDRLERVIKEL